MDSADATPDRTLKITPFEVEVGEARIDYDSVIRDFGSTPISKALLDRFERLTGKQAHPFLRRGLYFSHRDFDKILDLYERKKPFYIFTGRGPSSGQMHIGHMVPFLFTAYMQRTFDCPLVIQINDDEKFFWKDVALEELYALSEENIREVLAFGFDPEKTFVFRNSEYVGRMYTTVCKIQKRVTFNQVKAIFGVTASSSIGQIAFPAMQAAPSFSSAFPGLFDRSDLPCLILCAIDQDPYFRMTRDVAPRLKAPKPALLHCKFLPGLHGVNSKMSASDGSSAISLGDSPEEIRRKINRSVSGGGKTRELQRQHGADLERDVPIAYLRFFLEDDAELLRVERAYECGEMETGEVKRLLAETLTPVLLRLQKARAGVTEADVSRAKTERRIRLE